MGVDILGPTFTTHWLSPCNLVWMLIESEKQDPGGQMQAAHTAAWPRTNSGNTQDATFQMLDISWLPFILVPRWSLHIYTDTTNMFLVHFLINYNIYFSQQHWIFILGFFDILDIILDWLLHIGWKLKAPLHYSCFWDILHIDVVSMPKLKPPCTVHYNISL